MTALYSRLIMRYLLGRKGRSLMTFLGIALGVTMVVAVLLTNHAILASYEGLLDAAAGRADLQVSASSGAGLPQAAVAEVAGEAGVKAAAPVVTSGAPLVAGSRQSSATIYGIDPEQDRQIRDYKLTDGRLPGAGSEREIAVSTDLARNLDLHTGDKVKLLTTRGMQEFTVVGAFNSAGTVRGALGPFAVMPLEAAQTAFGKEGKVDLIDLLAAPGTGVADLKQRLAGRLGTRARVGAPVERGKDMQKLLDSIIFLLTMAGSISLFAGAFIIYTNVSMGVAERRRDLSILRALGMKRGEVLTLVLAEAGTLGLSGALLGMLWGWGLARSMAVQMTGQFLSVYGIEAARVSITAEAAVTALIVGVGVSLFAAFAPAREALQVSPVEAMSPSESGGHAERYGWRRGLAGLALITCATCFIWVTWPKEGMLPDWLLRAWGLMLALDLLGIVVLLPVLLQVAARWVFRPVLSAVLGLPGRLAADNLVRQPRRTAATVSALMVSLTFMVGMGGVFASQAGTFDAWFDKTVGWDLSVSTSFTGLGAQVEMDPAFERELAAISGVKLVSPQKFTRIALSDGDLAYLQVFDHHRLRQYSETGLEEGDWNTAADAMERGGGVLISPAVAHRMHVGLGDSLTLPTPKGDQSFRVEAILTDLTSFGGMVELDWQDYTRFFDDRSASIFALVLQPGTDAQAVKQQILSRWGDQMHLSVRLNREFWAELRSVYDAFYKLMDGLIWIAVIVSGLAIANTLFASILERRHEFGILRAVGTRRGEVMRVVVGEALCTGAVGGLFGIVMGLLQQIYMVSSAEFINGSTWRLTLSWTSIGLAAVVALVLAPAVGLLPARWAARLDVVDALRYE